MKVRGNGRSVKVFLVHIEAVHVERRTVEQLGIYSIDDAVKRGRKTRNIGAALGDRVGNHELSG